MTTTMALLSTIEEVNLIDMHTYHQATGPMNTMAYDYHPLDDI